MRLQHSILLSFALSLVGCSAHFQSASREWDQPKPKLVSLQKSNGKPRLVLFDPGKYPVTDLKSEKTQTYKQTKNTSNWKVKPPDLQSSSGLTELPVRSSDRLPQGFWESTTQSAPVVEIARKMIGIPYRYGGETPEQGFDCSGLVHYVFGLRGIGMMRLANEQFLEGQPVSRQELLPGDLVFFSISGKIVDHVGIYAGEAQFIHAPRTGRVVSYDRLDSDYFSQRFQGARRIAG
ncbi:hypothetical protein COW36_08560 [bacterium (Candidatus Blackallbacteria) CG17_big_fil_post_rev_8_21_14_2_50_48_46]|uniref:NlpC/P60 domain-containing protein n=1 Tax=bacterium (Candidatus Blackallbacteria) CG17_big_fil_post_rev_8_21_14_2_50_48_46 TaxID=2014261 RepID=A0A2M7G691_9BACT|nr:MAG: hypothetical protein COW64_05860 [bacterium (Candidatus Blackallbacteria) CG18_big_fil_WC_8_21_14_2_50_49_26]PIW17538.1 MAG: hypothetical protein COW36_08560 [bacterium (Candidatus Blackallbacteria) CG17_big_fil_post_rev_8_21_14_2_50_48_46]PIW48393.1 MAG: hypothetical protein COW20_09910 [bacterium (Candidatus Blackallbacteria) CG13_big_fil_rev_8_21_14_2_50_49_14]